MLRKKPVRIPTLAAFSAIVFFMLTGVFLSNNFTLPWSKAASFDLYPEDVRISKRQFVIDRAKELLRELNLRDEVKKSLEDD